MLFLFKKTPAALGSPEWIIVGLGNPGTKYEDTRHNAGYFAVEQIAELCRAKIGKLKFKSLTAIVEFAGKKCLLLKPTTFMNSSGEAVCEAVGFYKIPPERVLIFSDDISLAVGQIRVKRKGSHGGHNGLRNIIQLSGSDMFPRVKIGVGQKPAEWELIDWVLSRFSKDEGKLLEPAIRNAADAAKMILADDLDSAMNKFNGAK